MAFKKIDDRVLNRVTIVNGARSGLRGQLTQGLVMKARATERLSRAPDCCRVHR